VWTRKIALSTIESAFPAIGTLRGLRVDSRDGIALWGGRTTSVTVLGSAGSTKVTGDSFGAAMGLRSPWWTSATAPATSRATFPKDISSDSLADLLAVDGGGVLHVLLGNGAGAFSPVSAGTGWGGFDLITSAGAWTADNRDDVLARRGDTLYVYPGASGGKLLPRVTVSTGWSTRDLLLGMGDLDGDKYPDLVSRTTDGRLWLHRGDGAGHVLSTTSLGTGWQSMRTLAAPGDLTGDGIPDVLAVRASDNAVLIYPGNKGGTLSSRVAVAGSWGGYSDFIGPGDLTGDGRSDLVVRRSSDGALVVFAGNAMGVLTEHNVVAGTATWAAWTRWGR
jgi:hypothetical protein